MHKLLTMYALDDYCISVGRYFTEANAPNICAITESPVLCNFPFSIRQQQLTIPLHINLKTFFESAGLTLIPTRYVNNAAPRLFTDVIQVSGKENKISN